jgi:ectoine hydroxylase-related dioxygenase (phytanoyl-CoA dioxygenase family)
MKRDIEAGARPLTDHETAFFHTAGYIKLSHGVPVNEVDAIHRNTVAAFRSEQEPVRRNESGEVVRISRVFERGQPFTDLFTSPAVLRPLTSLLGENIEFVLNRHNHATVQGHLGKASRYHRDILSWSRSLVTVLIYLADDAHRGYTSVLPTSHRFIVRGKPNNGGTWLEEQPTLAALAQQAIPIPVKRGDILIMDGLLYHAAVEAEPADGRDRLVLTAAYRSVDELDPPHPANNAAILVQGSQIYRGDS